MKALTLLFLAALSATAQSDPPVTSTFSQALGTLQIVQEWTFGTSSGKNIKSISDLSQSFGPYGVFGSRTINDEWERYQPFNTQNFVFTPQSLNLVATIPSGGGLYPGGINSGQIWTDATFQPGTGGKSAYAFEVRMQVPSARGAWPASWLFTKLPGEADGSEIDNPEFFINGPDGVNHWNGFSHGPGLGAIIYALSPQQLYWAPGLNWSADFHDYQMIWTKDAVYKYIDGTLILAQHMIWTAKGAPQLGVNLAVGGTSRTNPGLQPTSTAEFPFYLAIDHITVWAK